MGGAIIKNEELVKRSTSTEIVQLDKRFLESISDVGEQVECDFEDPDCLFFVENKDLMDKISSEGVGSVKTFISKTKAHQSSAEGKGISEATVGLEAQLVITTRNAEEEQCYEKFDSVIMEIRNNQGDDCTTEVNVQDNKDGTYNISYFAKETGTCQASVMVNGEHVRDSPFTVQFNTRQYRPVLSFGQLGSSAGMFNRPWGVAVNERNEIAVTDGDNNRVQVFSVDGTYLRSFGGEGQQDGEIDGPSGIVFLNDGNIIVADSTNNRVQMFNGKGKYLRQFGHPHLNYPCGLSVDSNGNIIVVDSSVKLINIFSPSGQLLRKFGIGSLTNPCHCIQTGSNLIVSDVGDYFIKVFSGEGHFLYEFGKNEEGNGPRCLSVDKAGQLIVPDFDNCTIEVFDLSGKFITKFGRYGSEIGKLSGPASTAVLTDGRIVVCGRDNHRIQIFE